MRVKTLVLVPAVALLMNFIQLPIAQADTSANNRQQHVSRATTRITFGSPAYNKAFAYNYMVSKYRWSDKEFTCLVKLWNRESGWRVNAHNNSSGAHGIPQALPGKKMGKGWKTDPHVQIKWGLRYIQKRYDTPCGALGHSNRTGWY